MFLVSVFRGDVAPADSVNHSLVVGFYLVNLGYVSLALRIGSEILNVRMAMEALSWKLGMVFIVLGLMHFFNLFVFGLIRLSSKRKGVVVEPAEV